MARLSLRVTLGIALLGTLGVAAADDTSPWERFGIMPGAFVSATDSEVRFDSQGGIGTVVNLEDTLGIESDETTYRIDAFWRFGSTRRHQLEVHYYNSDRQGSRALGENTQIGNVVFPDGAAINSEIKLQFLNVDYSYAFFQDDRVRLAGAIGIHTTAFDFNVNAPSQNLSETQTFTAPLPVLGLRGDFIITPRWRFRASADALYLPLGNYTASVTDSLLALEYLPFEHVGVGLGVNNVRYKVESNSASSELDLKGKARLSYFGALAYLKLRF